MALTEQGIARTREILSEYKNLVGGFYGAESFTDYLTGIIANGSSSDYSKFTEGTQFGKEFSQKWINLYKLITDDLVSTVANLNNATEAYLNNQEMFNNTKMN